MATRTMRTIVSAALVLCACAPLASAQGIVTRSGAVVLYGNTARCTQPARVDYKKVRAKTPEWKTIRSEGVQAGSARYSLLISNLTKRIRKACRKVAEDQGRDCVVRKGDVADDKGLEVADLTREVIEKLESKDSSP